MIARYTRPEMAQLWSEAAQYQSWLEVELAACEAWAEIGVIPREDVAKLRQHARFDIQRIHELEKITRHDVVAFTRAVSESLGEERRWIHYGLTSSDVVDTAWAYRLKKANELILEALDHFLEVLARRAREHKYTLMIGRTHGVHAEPTTFGLKLALFYDMMQRNRARFVAVAEEMRVGKLSGAVGTFAHIPPEVERLTCEKLGLKPAPISTQVLARDRHAHYLSVLALIGTTLEQLAVEVRHLQRSEVREVEEAFGEGQKGSSAMPHKRNPIASENITGVARLLRSYMLAAYENITLWHERDISHSSVERVILPDATTLVHYALHRYANVMDTLKVYPQRMRRNMELTFGLYNSQRLLLMLIDKGLSREAAYDLVQPAAMQAWDEARPFYEIVRQHPTLTQYLSPEEIDEAFNPAYHLRHVDEIFRRVGLE
ncbi:MAG: adenylosuccinate lyase [Rhodothermus sp.]|nr:adenylosuccinate lyase [Rhodothermus sp.]